ncbi:hypothetical protein GGI07_005826 [Coemansia sp. Benny D115]|nr:hypothetical protein GGI07_005826 [Coemansia sp. Benny D115]
MEQGNNTSLLDIPDSPRGTNGVHSSAASTSQMSKSSTPEFLGPPRTLDDADSRKTFRMQPPSELLSRLHSFLPQIAEANKKLQDDVAQDPSKVDIENVGDDDEQYIEMDLGLGVFDMKPKNDNNDTDDIVIGRPTGSDSDSDESEVSDDEHVGGGRMGSRIIIKPSSIIKRERMSGKRPQIEVLNSDIRNTGVVSNSESESDSDSDSSKSSSADSDANIDSDSDVDMVN